MGTTTENPFGAMPDWWITGDVVVIQQATVLLVREAKDATLVRNAVGDYTLTLGSNGINDENALINVDVSAGAGLFKRWVTLSPTSRQLLLTNHLDALTDPTRISIAVNRVA